MGCGCKRSSNSRPRNIVKKSNPIKNNRNVGSSGRIIRRMIK